APAIAFPLVDPRQDAVAQVLAVRVNVDETGTLERFERGDRGHQFHAVVGGVSLATFQFLPVIAEGEDRAPAARPRIARAGTIGGDDDVRLAHPSIPESRTLLTAWWKRSLRQYSNGPFGRPSAPGGTSHQATRRVSRKRTARPRAAERS